MCARALLFVNNYSLDLNFVLTFINILLLDLNFALLFINYQIKVLLTK